MVTLNLILTYYALGILLLVFANIFLFPRLTKIAPKTNPKVSVLIPARNEARNLEKNLPLWLQVNYTNLEILVLDDNSEDATSAVASHFAPKINSVKGSPLPEGWLGKNWACHQLSEKAQGDIFLFVDADVSPSADGISNMVATLQAQQLDSCSAFLKQNFSHWTSKAVLPWALQFPIFAWPPLFLNRFFRFKSLAIGNGQWFAFTRAAYFRFGGHEAVKDSVIEDMSIARLLTKMSFSYEAFLAPEVAQVSMYHNMPELIEGLSKNLAFIFGPGLMKNIFFIFLYLGLIAPLFLMNGFLAVSLFICYTAVQIAFRQKNFNPFRAAVGLPMIIYLLVRSLFTTRMQQTTWKGRKLGSFATRLLILLVLIFPPGAFSEAPLASGELQAKAVILCYPTDKLIKNACDEIERRLKQCKTAQITLIRKDNLAPDSINNELTKEKLPPNTPIFIVGHGMADAEHRHYLAAQMFWKDHPEKVKQELIPQLLEEGNLISGKRLNTEITKSAPQSAIWYLSCHSGGNCTDGGNVGASCSSWETSAISQVNPLIKISLKIDPATRTLLRLLCEPGEFKQFDKDANNILSKEEWLGAFHTEHEKSVSIPTAQEGKARSPETTLRITKQLSPISTYQETPMGIDLTQRSCLNSATASGEPFLASPVLSHFALPYWTEQHGSAITQLPHRTNNPSVKTH